MPTTQSRRYIAASNALEEDDPRAGIAFPWNDYLARVSARRLKNAISNATAAGTPIGAGGSRLLRGKCEEHERVEAGAPQFFRAQAALFFEPGYTRNCLCPYDAATAR